MDGSTSTLLNIFIVLILVWLVVLVFSIISLTRRKDMIVPVKVFWGAVLFMAPVVGLIFYLIYGTRRNKGGGLTRF